MIYISELSLVETGSGLQFVVTLVSSQRIHWHLEEVDLRTEPAGVEPRPVSLTVLPFTLCTQVLDHTLVVVADVDVVRL